MTVVWSLAIILLYSISAFMKSLTPLQKFGIQILTPVLVWVCLTISTRGQVPVLIEPGMIEKIKNNTFPDLGQHNYNKTYNLGATGLRGWIYINGSDAGYDGTMTDKSREILISTVGANTPAAGIMQVDDVILGANSTNSGDVPNFDKDCRKEFGKALGAAEITGTLRVKRWRAGNEAYVNIPIEPMGTYTSTAPYNCPKSEKILKGARDYMVGRLLADPEFLTSSRSYANSINALALLAGVVPGSADYTQVKESLRDYALSLTPPDLALLECDAWEWGYACIFLNEYYLRIMEDRNSDPDFYSSSLVAQILARANGYTIALSRAQGQYGTFGHGGSELRIGGGLNGPIPSYGTIHAAGIPANIGIVLGKKVMELNGGQASAEVGPAVERATKFFAFYVDKGSIPYGEEGPWIEHGHCSNGKDQMAAVLFSLHPSKPAEAKYFSRMSVSSYRGVEYGHTGQGFSHLWAALGANTGGNFAMAKFMEKVRWLYDLKRRTDGSFVYEGQEQYGAGETVGQTYLGATSDNDGESYSDLNPTAFYLLAYSVPLKRIYLTGKNSTHSLSDETAVEAIAAANIRETCKTFTIDQLITALADYDPIVRQDVAIHLAGRPLSTADVTRLINAITGSTPTNDPRLRMGACQVLGIRRTRAALPALKERLSDTNGWVRAQAARALKEFGSDAETQLAGMLNAFIANSVDSETIDWVDPVHVSNIFLADTIFGGDGVSASALDAFDKNLTFTALEKGLREPSNVGRSMLQNFVAKLSLDEVKRLAPALVRAGKQPAPGNRMNPGEIRDVITKLFSKYKIEEGIPLTLMLKEQHWHGNDMSPFTLLQSYGSAAKEALPTLRKWEAHLPEFYRDPSIRGIIDEETGIERYGAIERSIRATINVIENSTAPQVTVNFKTLVASAAPPIYGLTTVNTSLRAEMSDLDGGTGHVSWRKLTGPGPVVFNPTKRSASEYTNASFSVPGTYVLRATAVDSSILDPLIWVTKTLGYYDFKTYEENLGAVTKDITVTIASAPELPGIPVSNGLVLRMDASQISGVSEEVQLNQWSDMSGDGNHAFRQNGSSAGFPKYITNGINGLPAIRFNSGSNDKGDSLKFTRIPTIRTVFWVLKENPGLTKGHFLLGDSETYHFHRGATPNSPLWDGTYTSPQIRNGTTKLMGNVINGTTTSLPSGSFQLVSLVTTGNVSADQICQDRIYNGSWQGDIAEILIYDRPLNGDEETKVGTYLSDKYGLTTTYKALPVSNGLVLRMDASQIGRTADGAQLNTWNDTSGAGNHAVRQLDSSNGFPKWVASGVNGLPVVRFDSSNRVAGDYFKFNRITDIRTVFWVLKEKAGLTNASFLLGDDTNYDFHRGSNNGPLWNPTYAAAEILGGVTKLMGNTINGSSTPFPSGSFQLVSLVTTGNVRANQICQDRLSHGSWQGDIAEILIYNRVLSATEQAMVGSYLTKKYQLSTNYPATISTIPAAVAAVADTTGKIRVTWNAVPGAIGYQVSSRNTQTGIEQTITSVTSPCEVTGLTTGVVYEFKVSSLYPSNVRSVYSSSVSATPGSALGYAAWAGNSLQGLTPGSNDKPMDDPDRDGVCNLMEFVLGGPPMTSSQTILPVLRKDGENWFFEYTRSDLSQATTTQVVEFSSDLTQWGQISIPADTRLSDGVVITARQVRVNIPTVGGNHKFVRLKVSQ